MASATPDASIFGDSGASPTPSPDPSALSILHFLNVLLRYRGAFVVVAATVVVFVLGSHILKERTFTATTSFMPQARRALSSTNALAAQLGISVGGGDAGESPQFYLELLKTHEILNMIAASPFPLRSGGTGPLERVYKISASNEPLARDAAIKRLISQLRAVASTKTGIISVTVTTADPALSVAIAKMLLNALGKFNLERRHTQATAEREFAEARMHDAASRLGSAEMRLQDFLQVNRDFRGAPRLMFEQDRLAREVAMRQELYTSLAKGYEQAKLDEVRETPTITVIQPPDMPSSADPRGLVKRGLLALLVGVFFGTAAAFARQYLARAKEHEVDEFAEFSALKEETLANLRHPVRSFRRRSQPLTAD